MPIYEYRCKNCGNSFDALRSVQAADKPIECSQCHKEDSKRLLSTFFAHGQSKSTSSRLLRADAVAVQADPVLLAGIEVIWILNVRT